MVCTCLCFLTIPRPVNLHSRFRLISVLACGFCYELMLNYKPSTRIRLPLLGFMVEDCTMPVSYILTIFSGRTSFSSLSGLILSSCASNSQYNGSHTGPQYWHALESRPAPCISLTWIRRLPTSSALSRTLNMKIFINRVLPYVLYAMAFPYFNPC